MDSKQISVLLLEDESAHAEAMRRALESADTHFDIQVVGSLQEYRKNVMLKLPDIALLDMVLPDGNALELLNSPPEAKGFPMLILTSQGNEQAAVAAMKAGAQDYIVKSAEIFADLPRILTSVLSKWELLRKHQQAQVIIAEQNARLLSIINSPTDIQIFSLDRNYCYTCFNENHRKTMRSVWQADIRIGMNLLECMTIPEFRGIARSSIDRVLAGENIQEVQYQQN